MSWMFIFALLILLMIRGGYMDRFPVRAALMGVAAADLLVTFYLVFSLNMDIRVWQVDAAMTLFAAVIVSFILNRLLGSVRRGTE